MRRCALRRSAAPFRHATCRSAGGTTPSWFQEEPGPPGPGSAAHQTLPIPPRSVQLDRRNRGRNFKHSLQKWMVAAWHRCRRTGCRSSIDCMAREAQSSLTLAARLPELLTRNTEVARPECWLRKIAHQGPAGAGRAVRFMFPPLRSTTCLPMLNSAFRGPAGRFQFCAITLAPMGGGPVNLPDGLIARQVPELSSGLLHRDPSSLQDDSPSNSGRQISDPQKSGATRIPVLLNLVKALFW